MKLICRQSDLNNNLSLVSRAVSSRPQQPVLGNVLLIADDQENCLRLTAFDLSLGIQTRFTADVQQGGSITLPAKLLNDIVSRLPDGDITLELDPDGDLGGSLLTTITSESGRFQFGD